MTSFKKEREKLIGIYTRIRSFHGKGDKMTPRYILVMTYTHAVHYICAVLAVIFFQFHDRWCIACAV